MNKPTTETTEVKLSRILATLQKASGAKVTDIKLVIRGLQRKEASGALPPNKGWVFAAQEAKTALRMAALAGYPCRSEFAEGQMKAAVKRAEKWILAAA